MHGSVRLKDAAMYRGGRKGQMKSLPDPSNLPFKVKESV
jgi:hypothetical protein